MNAPDRYERFVVPEDVKKVEYEKDPRVLDAGTFTVQREDHTLGNLIRVKLLEDKEVSFAGYKIPHPLEYRMLFKVQTRPISDPVKAMVKATSELALEIETIKAAFMEEEARLAQAPQ